MMIRRREERDWLVKVREEKSKLFEQARASRERAMRLGVGLPVANKADAEKHSATKLSRISEASNITNVTRASIASSSDDSFMSVHSTIQTNLKIPPLTLDHHSHFYNLWVKILKISTEKASCNFELSLLSNYIQATIMTLKPFDKDFEYRFINKKNNLIKIFEEISTSFSHENLNSNLEEIINEITFLIFFGKIDHDCQQNLTSGPWFSEGLLNSKLFQEWFEKSVKNCFQALDLKLSLRRDRIESKLQSREKETVTDLKLPNLQGGPGLMYV